MVCFCVRVDVLAERVEESRNLWCISAWNAARKNGTYVGRAARYRKPRTPLGGLSNRGKWVLVEEAFAVKRHADENRVVQRPLHDMGVADVAWVDEEHLMSEENEADRCAGLHVS
jgi:hypothetical protein